MNTALVVSAVLLGLAGTPHCAVMCAAPCAALVGQRRSRALPLFLLARLTGYAAVGAVVASGMQLLGQWAQLARALQPVWAAVHLAMAGLGLWMIWYGRQPQWRGLRWRQPAPAGFAGLPGMVGMVGLGGLAGSAQGVPMHGPVPSSEPPPGALRQWLAPLAAGSAWVALPCGLLQSALLLAALSNDAASGALAMAGFAAASSLGLVGGPWLWRWSRRSGASRLGRWPLDQVLARLAGAVLLLASGWALGHGVWQRIAAWC